VHFVHRDVGWNEWAEEKWSRLSLDSDNPARVLGLVGSEHLIVSVNRRHRLRRLSSFVKAEAADISVVRFL